MNTDSTNTPDMQVVRDAPPEPNRGPSRDWAPDLDWNGDLSPADAILIDALGV